MQIISPYRIYYNIDFILVGSMGYYYRVYPLIYSFVNNGFNGLIGYKIGSLLLDYLTEHYLKG